MKRPRSTANDQERESLNKQHPLSEITNCQAWSDFTDFWIATLPFFVQRDLHQLSCVCQSWYSLVWKHLIPWAQPGMTFSDSVNNKSSVAKYLSKVPNLRALKFSSYKWLPLLTMLPNLCSLSYEASYSSPLASQLFQGISHLTNLSRLDCSLPDTSHFDASTCNFHHFKNLTHLHLGAVYADVLPHLIELTRLEKLFLYLEDFMKTPLGGLTRLHDLEIDGDVSEKPIWENSELGRLTNLKTLKLYLPSHQVSYKGLEDLTNLVSLVYQDFSLVPNTSFLKSLRNLKTLVAHAHWDNGTFLYLTGLQALHHRCPTRYFDLISHLTNLKQLTTSPDLLPEMMNLSPLTQLSTLKIKQNHPSPLFSSEEEDFKIDALGTLTSLSSLAIPTPTQNIDFTCGLTNLTKLTINVIRDPTRSQLNFSPLGRLTNLQTLDFKSNVLPREFCPSMAHLSNLTSFKCEAITEPFRSLGSCLTRLKHLSLRGPISSDFLWEIARGFTQLETLDLTGYDGIAHEPQTDDSESSEDGTWSTRAMLKPLLSLPNLGALFWEACTDRQFVADQIEARKIASTK